MSNRISFYDDRSNAGDGQASRCSVCRGQDDSAGVEVFYATLNEDQKMKLDTSEWLGRSGNGTNKVLTHTLTFDWIAHAGH